MTLLEAAQALRARRVSAVELAQQALAAIERRNAELNAFITITGEHALERARLADEELARGADRGALHGIPIAYKDLVHTRGVLTTGGTRIFKDHVPDNDAEIVKRLDAAGAVMIGKTGLHEFAYGITGSNPHFGFVRNPANPEHIPGGSSGGSGAAVADGMVFMAIGTDTGGSIRIPASFCGTVGFKPTFDLVSREGVMPLGYSLDHIGPLTRTVRDAAVVMRVLARREIALPPDAPAVRGVRVGIPQRYFFEHLDAGVERAVRKAMAAIEAQGAKLEPVELPDMAALNAISRVILLAEATAGLEKHLARRDEIGDDVRALLDQGRLVPATDYVNAQRLRRIFQRECARVWKSVDVLLTPTTPSAAPRIGQTTMTIGDHTEDVRLMATRFVRGINVLGWPAISLPCGKDDAGLPVGLQLAARPFGDAELLRISAAVEAAIA